MRGFYLPCPLCRHGELPYISPPVELALGRARVISVAVGTLDFAVSSVDNQFSSLVTADLTTGIDSLSLGFPVTTGALTTAPLYIPAAIGVRDNMMRISCHNITPYVQQGSK